MSIFHKERRFENSTALASSQQVYHLTHDNGESEVVEVWAHIVNDKLYYHHSPEFSPEWWEDESGQKVPMPTGAIKAPF